jgi:sensor domain CHASE-containing protein
MKAMVIVLAAVTLMVGACQRTWAEDAVISAQQVQQLQNQLAAMQNEMRGMRQALASRDIPSSSRETLQRYIQRMDQNWQAMNTQCCKMNPAGCR